MKLATWRKERGMTQVDLAAALGCSQSYISQIERAVEPIVPSRELMAVIFRVTDGAVEPNDFYDLPALAGAPLSEAA